MSPISPLLTAMLLCPAGACLVDAPAATPPASLSGSWLGRLQAGPVSLRILFHIRKVNGVYSGAIESADQSPARIPMDSVTLTEGKVHLRISPLQASFEGELSRDAEEIRGSFTQGVELPLVMRRIETVPEPSEPWRPAYASKEIERRLNELAQSGEKIPPSWDLAALQVEAEEWNAAPLPLPVRLRLARMGDLLERPAASAGSGKQAALRLAGTLLHAGGLRDRALAVLRSAQSGDQPDELLAMQIESLERAGEPRRRGEDAIDALARSHRAMHKIPGLSLALVSGGKIIKAAGYGSADIARERPSTAETLYEIGSVTKQFTATAILLLMQDGKLDLDDPVGKFLPELPETWRGCSLRRLLTHTSGIKSFTDLPAVMLNPGKEYAAAELLALVADAPLQFEGGAEWRYSNTGYFLLGMVIEKLSGLDYGAFLKKRLFDPLGMGSTGPSKKEPMTAGRAAGYSLSGGRFVEAPYWHISSRGGAGNLVSSVLDMAKWDEALRSDKIVTAASREMLWTPYRLSTGDSTGYGLGWGIIALGARRAVSHGGGLPGWSSYLVRLPEDDLMVVVLTNRDGAPAAELAHTVLRLHLGESENSKPVDAPGVAPELRKLLVALAGESPSNDLLTGQADAIWYGSLADTSTFLRQQGSPRDIEILAKHEPAADSQAYQARVRFEKSSWIFTFARNEGRWTWLSARPE